MVQLGGRLPASYITSAATMLDTNVVCLLHPVTRLCVFIWMCVGDDTGEPSYFLLFQERERERRNTKD